MYNAVLGPIQLLTVLLVLAATACATAAPAAPVATATNTPVPVTATVTKPPTSMPRPSATPNVAATQAAEAFQARLDNYADKGYISTSAGTSYDLQDYKNQWAEINYFSDIGSTGYDKPVKDFVFTGDFQWESAVKNPETSGCGLYYRLQENGNYYTAYLDTERVVMGGYEASQGHFVKRFGVTTGSGRVNYESPSRANFTLIMNGHMAYVLADDQFVGSYTLYTEKLLDPGFIGYFVKSGTNKDFGTRCTIENAKLWVPKQ